MLSHMIGTVIVGALCVGLLALTEWLRTLLYDYRFTEEAVEILLFRRFPIKRFPNVELLDVRIATLWDVLVSGDLFSGTGWGNRLFAKNLILYRRNGSRIVITPRDLAAAHTYLRARLREARPA